MKFATFVVITIGVGATVGWLAPDAAGDDAEPNAAATAADEAERQLEVLDEESWLAGETFLPRSEDGHFYADVMIDGSTVNLMVDTGASMVALTADDAETAGVEWSEEDIQPVAKGASGTVHGVRVLLDHVQLGELEAKRVEAVVIPEGLHVSLLGQSFLSKVRRVEIEHDRMVLGG